MNTARRFATTTLIAALSLTAVAGCSSDADADGTGSTTGTSGRTLADDVAADLGYYAQVFQETQAADPDSYPQSIEYFAAPDREPKTADATYMACSGSLPTPGVGVEDVVVIYADAGDKVYFISSLLDDGFAVHESKGPFPQVQAAYDICPLTDEIGELSAGHQGLVVVADDDVTTW